MEKNNAFKVKKTDDENVSELQHAVKMTELNNVMRTTVSGFTMLFKGEKFIKACIKNHIDFVDEWVFCITDGEKIPKELEELQKEYNIIKVIFDKSKARCTKRGRLWDNEVDGRNKLLRTCKSDWLLQIDVDELYDPKFLKRMHALVDSTKEDGFFFRKINLWGDKKTYRIDEPWYPDIGGVKLFRNAPDIKYVGYTHPTVWNGLEMFHRRDEVLVDEHIFHYKRVFPIIIANDGNFNSLNLGKEDLRPLTIDQPEAARYIK